MKSNVKQAEVKKALYFNVSTSKGQKSVVEGNSNLDGAVELQSPLEIPGNFLITLNFIF